MTKMQKLGIVMNFGFKEVKHAKLIVNVTYDGESIELKTYEGEYRNVMSLISDHMDVESFGECGGMGRCATCMAEIIFSEKKLPSSDRNEYATLSKFGNTNTNVRLTCQLNVDESVNGIRLKLLNV